MVHQLSYCILIMTVRDQEANVSKKECHRSCMSCKNPLWYTDTTLIVISEISKGTISIESADVFVCYMLRV